jgi:hypothetical protein
MGPLSGWDQQKILYEDKKPTKVEKICAIIEGFAAHK